MPTYILGCTTPLWSNKNTVSASSPFWSLPVQGVRALVVQGLFNDSLAPRFGVASRPFPDFRKEQLGSIFGYLPHMSHMKTTRCAPWAVLVSHDTEARE